MRIVAGAWRGRALTAPPGEATRPTSDRARQALFDVLMHAPWGGREWLEQAVVLDAFAGTGALALEALSRGAVRAVCLERDAGALAALRANIAACGATESCTVRRADALRPPPGVPCALVFLDPPYGQGLVPRAVAALRQAGWLGPPGILVAETGRGEELPDLGTKLADRIHGAARITIWQTAGEADALA